MSRTLDIRSVKVKEYIKQGLPINQAMIKAGYSQAYASKRNGNKAMVDLIEKAKEEYTNSFVSEAQSQGIDGAYVFNRLRKAIDKDDDFNAINAIKVMNGVMLKSGEKKGNISNLNVFMVPNQSNKQEWNQKIKKFKNVIDVKDNSK